MTRLGLLWFHLDLWNESNWKLLMYLAAYRGLCSSAMRSCCFVYFLCYCCYLFVTEKLLSMQMENFVHFLQHDLEKDFGLDDDAVLLELSVSYNLRDTGWWISWSRLCCQRLIVLAFTCLKQIVGLFHSCPLSELLILKGDNSKLYVTFSKISNSSSLLETFAHATFCSVMKLAVETLWAINISVIIAAVSLAGNHLTKTYNHFMTHFLCIVIAS